ncbi:MAG: endonuclease/exonuclease/phosphatase family protein [Planctomycetota bacterium]
MRRFLITTVLLLVIVFGGWLLYNRNRINSAGDVVTLIREAIPAIPASFSNSGDAQPAAFDPRNPETVRIASFKLNSRTGAAEHPAAMRLMTEICRQFDLIALQEVSDQGNQWLSRLAVSLSEATGSQFRYITGGQSDGVQFAILFDANRLDVDHLNTYTVNDPDGVLSRPPLVGWFRARNAPPESAFTFTVANVQLDANRPDLELAYLQELFRAIRNDGRGEDDVIIAGDFSAGDRGLGLVREKSNLTWVVSNQATDTMQQSQYDNLVFSELATVEFTGFADVFDFMKFYNLRLQDAIGISEHLPVWAEFSVYEGFGEGRVAESGAELNR